MRPHRDLAAALAALLLGLACAAGAQPPQTLSPFGESKVAPDIALELLDGSKLKLSQLRGKVVVVNFWATWCPPCQREMPSLERLKSLIKGEPVEIVAVNAGEDEEAIERFRAGAQPPLTIRIALDRQAEAMRAFSVQGLPTTYVLDRQGRFALRALGGRTFDDPGIVAIIRALSAK